MIVYFHADGSNTVSHLHVPDRSLAYESVRIIEIRDDGAVIVRKDQFGETGEILSSLPSKRARA